MGPPHHSIGGSIGYSYSGVMDFLREQELRVQEREEKLIGEKRQLEERVKSLEDELQKQM